MKSVLFAFALFFFAQSQPQAPASIEGVVVRMGTSTPVAGARVGMGGAQTTTDPNGRFMFPNVLPGRYRLVANHIDYVPTTITERKGLGRIAEVTIASGEAVNDIVLALTPNGLISGRVYDGNSKAISDAIVEALKQAYQDGRRILVPVASTRSSKSGEYALLSLAPGPYIVRAALSESSSGTSDAPLPVYFPNTSNPSLASSVDLPPGVNFTGVDLTIIDVSPVRVSGFVTDAFTGNPAAGAAVTLVPRRGTVATGTLQRATVSRTGVFEFRRMAPGSYDLVATMRNALAEQLAASAPVEVGDADIDAVALILQPQLSMNGRVIIENGQGSSSNFNLQNVRVELRREPYTPELLVLLPTVAADGAFTLAGITPGDYQLKVNAGGLKGYVKAARYGAINALNPPFHIGGPGQFEIAISLNTGSLDTIVRDDSLKPILDATIVLVPDPPLRPRSDLYYSGSSDATGRLRFDSLAPGDYRAFAWEDVPSDAWQDPDFIRLYEERGRRVRVSEGSRESVELRLISP